MKKLFCLIFSSVLTWMISCPEPLSASNSVALTGLDNANIVQTIIKPTPTPVPVVATPKPILAATKPLTPKPSLPKNSISISGKTLNIVNVSSTTVDSGSHVNKIGKLLYGHNSAAVFGGLKNLRLGQTFSVTENGKTTTYKITYIDTYEKNGNLLQKNGAKSYMNMVQNAKDVNRVAHSLAIMTCAGTSLGGGDATHRLVIFADTI